MPKTATAGRTKAERQPLSRARIELAALDLIEDVGLAEFSTRKLASVLGCEAMSIYHYFPSKGHLMDALIDHVVDETAMPDPSLAWIEQVRQLGHEIRRAFTKRPKLFIFVGTHRMNTPKGLAFLNKVISLFEQSGLTREMSMRVFRSVSYYVMGAGLDETAGYSRGPSTVDPVPLETMRTQYLAVLNAGQYFRPADFDKTFEVGWEIMLSGIELLRLQGDG